MRSSLPVRLSRPLSLFDSFFSDNLPEVYPEHVAPATNIAETSENLSLSFEMPGISEEDISLDIENRKLTVTAERTAAEKVEGTTWHRREQRTGKWSRTIQLPESADQGNVEAVYKQGILHVTIGKHPKSKPQKIQIKGS